MTIEADVIVVGTGAGGAPVALQAARRGATVVMLERGPYYTRADFVHDEVAIARRSFFVPASGTDPHVLVDGDQKPRRTHEGWTACCVGGATVHMSGFFYRLHPEDFRVRDFLGPISGATHANWPIAYADLAPYYAAIANEIGLSGPEEEGPYAPKPSVPYPLPEVATHPVAALIDAAGAHKGVHPFVTTRAIISADYKDGRKGCVYCHLCGGFGCEMGAKSSTLETLLPKALATKKCRMISDAMVLRIEADASGRASGVIYRDASGVDHRVNAKVVVVACSAIESARLLLMSTSPQFPNGMGNAEGQVGRHLMFSTLSKAHGSFQFSKSMTRAEMLRDHAPFLGRSVLDYYLPKNAPVQKAGALNFLFPSGGPIAQSEGIALGGGEVIFGSELKRRWQYYWHEQKQIDCEAFGEYLPTQGTHVTLDDSIRDQFALPAARMSIKRHEHDIKVSQYLGQRAVELIGAAGADEVWQSHIGGRTMHLPMGGCRMGNDSTECVVDKNCRSHQVPNLYVTDGSVFPSSGGVPPTFTILANAMRVGDLIQYQ